MDSKSQRFRIFPIAHTEPLRLIASLKFKWYMHSLGLPLSESCPKCKIGKLEGREQKVDYILESYSCGHSQRILLRGFAVGVGVAATFGEEHKLPSAKPLVFTKSDLFAGKISGSPNQDLLGYHQTTKYRLLNAEYALKLILENYDNGVAFAVGLTGFLVQAKSSLDSLSEEININYSLGLSNPRWVTNIEKLMRQRPIAELTLKNPNLAQILSQEISLVKGSWFKEFKTFRDEEGVHRKRSPRRIVAGRPAHDIKIGSKSVAEYCVEVLSSINGIIEECYGSML